MTPEQKYSTDPVFTRVVCTMENIIHEAQLTPSELREAATLACIHYERRSVLPRVVIPEKVINALATIEWYRTQQRESRGSI